MYKRIVLAFDSTVEGRMALREGALLAQTCGAQVFLLSVLVDGPWSPLAEGAQAGAATLQLDAYRVVLQDGLDKLTQLGLRPEGRLVRGDPTQQISDYAREVGADLVVVGHRRRNFIERWWGGESGAYIVDNLDCSLLVARNGGAD